MSNKVFGVICTSGDEEEVTELGFWFTKKHAIAYATQENKKQEDGYHQFTVIEMDSIPKAKDLLKLLGAKQVYVKGVNSYDDISEMHKNTK